MCSNADVWLCLGFSEHATDQIMPDWLVAPICFVVLFGFVGFALRQGTKVKPDRNNRIFGPDGSSGSDSSNGGSGSGGGHSF